MFRAILEGIAHGTRHALDAYAEAGQRPARIFAVGGGTRNQVWAQATSDICGITQLVREKTVGASYGNAFLAAMALGDATPPDIERWNPVVATLRPRGELKDLYDGRHAAFRGLYPATKPFLP